MRLPLRLIVFLMLAAGPARSEPLPVVWFYTEGCRRCQEVKGLVADLEKQYEGRIRVERLDIADIGNYRRLMDLERRHGVLESHPMAIFAGTRHFLGDAAILREFPDALPALVAGAREPAPAPPADSPSGIASDAPGQAPDGVFAHMTPWMVALAGLADGINPCAFASVVFLISVLALRRTTRGAVLSAGGAFCAGVFLTYFAMGFGALKAVRRLESFQGAATAFYWVIVAGAVVLGALSWRDARVYGRTGREERLLLKVPAASRRLMHRVLRRLTGAGPLCAGCLAAGAVVSVLEVVCTGQIYLPTIMVMLQDDSACRSGIWYLVLYNAMFIIPLLAVVVLFTFGLQLSLLIRFSRHSVVTGKLALGCFFFALAAMLTLLRILG